MIVFIFVIGVLFLIALIAFSAENTFVKKKIPVIKSFMAFVIILGHLSCRVPSGWIQPFRFWGAPFVSMFLFISGYGMWQSFLSNYGLSVYVLCTVVLTVLLAELVSFASHKVFVLGKKS